MSNNYSNINICLINPPVFKIVEPYYDLPRFPRTALAFLAGHLISKQPSFNVEVLDCKFDQLSFNDAVNNVSNNHCNIVGITAMTNEIKPAAKLAEMLKEKHPNLLIIIGGVHATSIPEETLREFPCFDIAVVGEGEDTLLSLLLALKNNESIDIPGVSYLKNNTFISNGTSIMLPDQDSLSPAWNLFRSAEEYMIQSSRGCPFACNFCMNPGGRIVRPRTVETTLDEIGWLIENKNPKSIYFGDEIFTVKRDRAMDICRGLIERGYNKKISWWCQTHVNTIDKELVSLMKEANCKTVGLGIETGDAQTLKKMGKGTSKEKILKAINIMKDAKLRFNTFFILGQPNETYESAKNTIDFAIELNPTIPIFGVMVPYPGTSIWDMARKGEAGYKLLSHDWNHFNKQVGNALELEGITRKQLEQLQLMGYVKVFLLNYRFLDFLRFLISYRREAFEVAIKQVKRFFMPLYFSKNKGSL